MTVPANIDTLLLGGQRGYQIERSLRFNSPDSAYLNRTPASAGNRKTWTWSAWVKRAGRNASYGQRLYSARPSLGTYTQWSCRTSADDQFELEANGGTYLRTTMVFRDFSAWYHIAIAVDTTQATSSDRIKLYVNGVQVTAFASSTYPSLNADTSVNDSVIHNIGRDPYDAQYYFDGYMTEVHLVDGQALTPSSFGETDTITGVWKPKRYSGSYGTNGFYLKFADNSGTTSTTLGKDSSGNGNNWTPNNFSVTAGAGNDSMIDTPTPYADGGNGRGNYCTWNPLDRTAATYSNGNLDVTSTSAASPYNMASTMRFPATGKWYAEVTLTGLGAGSPSIGIGKNNSDAYAVYRITGAYLTSGMGASTSGTPNTYTTNDVIGIAYDAGAGTLEFYKNGVDQTGNISGITASTEWAIILRADSASGDAATLNAGQRPFAYTPPSGFKALNTQNLPEPSIKKPSSYFDVVTYTGTGNTTTQTITLPGGFSPDLVWVKGRNESFFHRLTSTGLTQPNYLSTNSTDAEGTLNGTISSLNSNGFTVNGNNGTGGTNTSGINYVAWCWDESATPGFDIVTWTGDGAASRNISHSLGVAPKMIISKTRTIAGGDAGYWDVYHASLAAQNTLFLHTTGAATSAPTVWPSAPTSTVFTVGNGSGVNVSGSTYVAYLWSEVAGFSKFGSYTGNGSSDGPFVYCGFRPRWVMVKRINATENWAINDSSRSPTNPADAFLRPDESSAESSLAVTMDLLSNGFKLRTTDTKANASGSTYIFAAFAESPFKYSLAR